MPEDIPTESVLIMKQQGLSNNQIIAALQRQGYNTNQILDSMNQADLRMQIKRPFNIEGGKMAEQNIPESSQGFAQGMDSSGSFETIGSDRIEEIAESIIEEKWTDLMENINRIIEWKDKTETRITQAETIIKTMKDDFDRLHSSVLERVGDYDKHIGEVGTEVKALEKVFQKVLPGFIENISELSRITEEMKKQSR